MMFYELADRCTALGVHAPTVDDYTAVIEPIYNHHPAFEVANAKERCAAMWAQFGLGIFIAMRPEAEAAMEREKEIRSLRAQIIELENKREALLAEIKHVRELWDKAENLMPESEEE